MPYELSFTRRVEVTGREEYINECCIGGDVVVGQLLPLIHAFGQSVTSWLAIEVTTGVTLRTKTAAASRCTRSHPFGNYMPNPYNVAGSGSSSGSLSISDGGVGDAGTVTVTCNSAPPVAVWIIGRPGTCGAEPG
jgi:hypothetical protein